MSRGEEDGAGEEEGLESHDTLSATKYRVARSVVARLFLCDQANTLLEYKSMDSVNSPCKGGGKILSTEMRGLIPKDAASISMM